MTNRRVLPEPSFVQHAPFCLCCGYNLEGLPPPPGACPECGVAYINDHLMLVGIPKHMTKNTSPIRRVIWGAFLAMAIGFYFLWGFLVFSYPWVAAAWAAAILGCLVWLLATSQRERAVYERFVITSGGIARLPYKMLEGETNIDTVYAAWGSADSFVIERVGPYWKRLVIGNVDVNNKVVNPVFEAGFRCSDENAMLVRTAMEQAMRKSRPAPTEAQAPA